MEHVTTASGSIDEGIRFMNEHEKILKMIVLKDQAPLIFDVDHGALLVIWPDN
jgi:hypothetical protein